MQSLHGHLVRERRGGAAAAAGSAAKASAAGKAPPSSSAPANAANAGAPYAQLDLQARVGYR
jgi:hypothetical protein